MARIEDSSILTGGQSFLSQKNEILGQNKSERSSKTSKTKSVFSKLLDTETTQTQQSENIVWGDNYLQEAGDTMREIGLLGERIKKNRNYDDVQEYKRLIKNFIKNVLDKSERIEARVTGSEFRHTLKSKAIINIIDKELNELTREFFSTQSSSIRIAASIDKIQGLLVDLDS